MAVLYKDINTLVSIVISRCFERRKHLESYQPHLNVFHVASERPVQEHLDKKKSLTQLGVQCCF